MFLVVLYKAFCLCVIILVILRLSDQAVPAELEKSPPDYHAVADFLHDNFDGLEV